MSSTTEDGMVGILLVVFFQAEDGIRDRLVTGVQTCALPIWAKWKREFGTLFVTGKKI